MRTNSTWRIGLVALAVLVVASSAFAGPLSWSPAAACEISASASPNQAQVFWQTFKDSLFLGIPSQTGSMVANQATQTLAQEIEPVLINAMGRVTSPALASLSVPALTEGLGLFTSQAGWVAGSNLYQSKVKGQTPKPLDCVEVGASAAAAVLGGRVVSAFVPGAVGKWMGQWFFWQLASSAVQLERSGQKLTVSTLLQAMNIPKMTLQALVTEGFAYLGQKVIARAILSALPGGQVWGTVVTMGVQLVMASLGNALATAFYETFLAGHLGTDAAVQVVTINPPGTPRLQGTHTSAPGSIADLASLAASMRQAYEQFLEISAARGATDLKTVHAYVEYASARSRYDTARASANADR